MSSAPETTSDSQKILIIEDSPDLGPLLQMHLECLGYPLELVADGEIGLERILKNSYRLVVLDVNLPGKDGFEIASAVREKGLAVPILMLTSRDDELDKIIGLNRGADDYLTKPFSAGELVARINALLRRAAFGSKSTAPNSAQPESNILSFGPLQIDRSTRAVKLASEEISLTALEYDLLEFLATNAGRIVTREEILQQVWQTSVSGYDASLNSILSRLRKKLERDPLNPVWLCTVRGVGYRFSAPEKN